MIEAWLKLSFIIYREGERLPDNYIYIYAVDQWEIFFSKSNLSRTVIMHYLRHSDQRRKKRMKEKQNLYLNSAYRLFDAYGIASRITNRAKLTILKLNVFHFSLKFQFCRATLAIFYLKFKTNFIVR